MRAVVGNRLSRTESTVGIRTARAPESPVSRQTEEVIDLAAVHRSIAVRVLTPVSVIEVAAVPIARVVSAKAARALAEAIVSEIGAIKASVAAESTAIE